MSDLWILGSYSGFGHGMGYPEKHAATRSDVLEWLGWEECPECAGTGQCCGHKGCHNNCLDGLVPPASQVEAAARGRWESSRLPSSEPWEQAWREDGVILRAEFRAALIAAMKAVSDE